MKLCPNCVSDQELKGFITSSDDIDDCKLCSSKKQPCIDVTELLDFFQELVDNFRIVKKGESLKNRIQVNWSFFSSSNIATKVIDFVLPNLSTKISSSKQSVEYIDDIIDNYSYWETLKEELKWHKRFISNIKYLDEDLGWGGFFNTQFELNPNEELFRARIHQQSRLAAFEIEEMMCPKKEIVSGGRANPLGIPFLYLSDNPETVLYEVRASYLDELSIAIFRLKEKHHSIKIVDFTENTALFQPSDVNQIIKAKLLRDRISKDLSKPMRRFDSEIEYIPTQFICEFIKVFTGAEGIRFRSSVHPKGKNIVIFDQEKMECKSVKLMQVNKQVLKSVEMK